MVCGNLYLQLQYVADLCYVVTCTYNWYVADLLYVVTCTYNWYVADLLYVVTCTYNYGTWQTYGMW